MPVVTLLTLIRVLAGVLSEWWSLRWPSSLLHTHEAWGGVKVFCTPWNGATSQGEHPTKPGALMCVCLWGGPKGHITVRSEDKITPISSIANVCSLGLEQVFHNSLEFGAMYLMTLLVSLSHCAHTMLKIRSATGGCIQKRASLIRVFKLVHSSNWLHSSWSRWWDRCVHSLSHWTQGSGNLPCIFSAHFLALGHISPVSVFYRFILFSQESC